jgi:hypothetical protein
VALSNVFGDRIISSDIWPACSPDHNLCDLFLLVFLKDKINNRNTRKEKEVKENIHKETANIPAEQLQRVSQNFFAGARNVFV